MINKENYEEYLCSYIDGELNDAEVKALFQFLDAHPVLKEEITAFEATKLQPDTSLVFENKESLLKKEGFATISFINWKTLIAAAGIALLLGFSWTILKENNKHITQPIVKTETPSIKDTLLQSPKQETILVVKEKKKHHTIPQLGAIFEEPPVFIPHEFIAAIPTKDFESNTLLPVDEKKQEATLATINTTVISTNIPQETEKKNLMDLLHYDQEKQASIQEVAQAITSKMDQAKSFSQNLKETTFAIRFGGRDYLFNH